MDETTTITLTEGPTKQVPINRRVSILKAYGSPLMRRAIGGELASSPLPLNSRNAVETTTLNMEGEGPSNRMLPPLPRRDIAGPSLEGSGSNTRKMLDDLRKSREDFDRDLYAYEKAKRDLQVVDSKLSKLQTNAVKAKEKFNSLANVAACRRTELTGLEIRDKIMDKSLKSLEEELNRTADELHKVRLQTAEVSSAHLKEAIDFGLNWNGTELGRKNREQINQQRIKEMERKKRELESELKDFLAAQKKVTECEQEIAILEQKLKEQNECKSKTNADLEKRIQELDKALVELNNEEKEYQLSSHLETEQIEKQINDIQSHILLLQGKNAEAKAASKSYKSECKKMVQNQDSMREDSPSVTVTPQNSEGCSNDEDQYLADAAAQVSQNLRSNDLPEPARIPPCNPPPAKVRAVGRQAPITAFMEQVSTARVFKRQNRSQASQGRSKSFGGASTIRKQTVIPVAPIQTSITTSGKTFTFKKKLSNSLNAGTTSPARDKENAFTGNNSFHNDYKDSSAGIEDGNVSEYFDPKQFSQFN